MLVPAMVYVLGMTQHEAHGTSLAVIAFVVLLSALYYAAHGHMNWIVGLVLALGGVIGATLGAWICSLTSARRLRMYFAIVLMLIAVRMIWDVIKPLPSIEGTATASPEMVEGLWSWMVVLGIGVASGAFSGLLGIGGGVILVPAMVLLMKIPQHTAQGISLAVIVPVSFFGGMIHHRLGNLRVDICKWLALGGIVGGLAGARIAIGLEGLTLRGIFGVLMLGLGVAMIRRRHEQRC